MGSTIKQKIALVTLMKPAEQRSAYAAFAMVFLLMAVYFVLRPVRDAMASDWSDTEVSLLWNIQFFISSGIVMLYCWCISRISFRQVVPMVYGLFALSFLMFYLITQTMSDPILVEKAFYLWVTAFSLLNLSVFWSFMSETFSKNQGKRLFPFIGAGASAGAIIGPAIPTIFAGTLGAANLMLLSAMGLLMVIPLVLFLIVVILFSTFNSLSKAVLILGNIPFALMGGVLALYISGSYVSVPASIGFIALLGVAILNGVVMLSHIESIKYKFRDLMSVVTHGAADRLRPILMTASTAMFGLIPLVAATGPGAEIQKPLATVVIGGLFTSTIATLYLLPILYFKLEQRNRD